MTAATERVFLANTKDLPRRTTAVLRSFLTVLIAALILGGCSSATGAPTPARAAPTPMPTSTTATATPTSSPVTTLPPPAHRPQTIHVLEDPIAFHTVAVAGCTNAAGCKGDQLIGTSRALDADTRANVGSLSVNCVLMDPGQNLYHCPANVITLTGRGEIVFDETVYIGNKAAPAGPWPIVSGTGEFLGATGTVASPADSTWTYGDFVIAIAG
jgi:hypothetical protein